MHHQKYHTYHSSKTVAPISKADPDENISPHEKFYCDASDGLFLFDTYCQLKKVWNCDGSDGFFLFDTYCQLKKFGTVMRLMAFIYLTHIAN